MVNAANAATSAVTAATTAGQAMKQEVGLNKDDFLKLFITQLKNQDPLNPQDSAQFVTQMAQLTQVEQAYNTNTNLKTLIDSVKGSTTLNATAMIGKTVTASGNQLNFTGETTPIAYNMPAASASTAIIIKNSAGSTVRTINAGASFTGQNVATWDGKADNGATVDPGVYTFAVKGKTADARDISGATYTTGKIDGIGFNGNEPILKVGIIEIPLAAVAGIY